MTWNQFKKHIDELLEREGISPDEQIWYIDVDHPSGESTGSDFYHDCPTVALDERNGISISS